jgi:hypothetical protein
MSNSGLWWVDNDDHDDDDDALNFVLQIRISEFNGRRSWRGLCPVEHCIGLLMMEERGRCFSFVLSRTPHETVV